MSLAVAYENLASRVLMVEIDKSVSSVWQTILGRDEGSRWLASEIIDFDLNRESVLAKLAGKPLSRRSLAFQTLLKNRVTRGGIMTVRAGLLRQGENGKGIHSRWYPQTLHDRIMAIAAMKSKIDFVNGDGRLVMRNKARNTSTCFFIDPPYTFAGKMAGKRLYKHFDIDHASLFELASTLRGEFLMTYDYSDAVLGLASQFGFDTRIVKMNSTHHRAMKEIIISRDLSWFRSLD